MTGSGEPTSEPALIRPEIMDLRRFSARLGSNPMLVQASNGNTSIKLDGELWIKASGRWLANALGEQSMVSVELDKIRQAVQAGREIASMPWTSALRPSIETPMHAVLPHRLVIHVHSINTIAWSIRRGAQTSLKVPLAGLRWRWIPYVASGMPLAREIEKSLVDAPATEIFILGNHGLVICAEDCQGALTLLTEVERRLAISPRALPKPDIALLKTIADSTPLAIPDDVSLHGLGIDPTSLSLLRGGTLFPCQAMFLGERLSVLRPEQIVRRRWRQQQDQRLRSWFVVAEGAGILLRRNPSRSELATLCALREVIQRTESSSDVRYLTQDELRNQSSTGRAAYEANVESNRNEAT